MQEDVFMKYIRVLALVCALLLVCTSAIAAEGDEVKALEDGHYNIRFDNGYNGYCARYGDHEAVEGDVFIERPTSILTHRETGKSVGNELKNYGVDYIHEMINDKFRAQIYIWYFTDDFRSWRLDPKRLEELEAITATRDVPDHGFSREIDKDTTQYLDFIALVPRDNPRQQVYFAYKVSYVIYADEGASVKLPNPFDSEDSQVLADPEYNKEYTREIGNNIVTYIIKPRPARDPEATVTPAPNAPSVPATGDGTPVALLAMLALVSVTCAMVLRRKRA